MSFERARKVADAVLYEGYVLYPYRASARKNRIRWQFGVLAPREWSLAGGCEHSSVQTECLIEAPGGDDPRLEVRVRFLQVQRRTVEEAGYPAGETFRAVETLDVGGRLLTEWEEGVEREVDLTGAIPLADLAGAGRVVPFEFPGGSEVELIPDPVGRVAARVVRERRPIAGELRVEAQKISSAPPLWKVRAAVENVTRWSDSAAPREVVLRSSMVGAHTLLGVSRGSFVSLLTPPDWASSAAASCSNVRTWPVVVGEPEERDVMLSSPIILYDYPEIAPESAGDLYDSTEIDEILTLRTMTLTDEEKREARATDDRAAAIIDRVDAMPPEMLDRLHGTMRYLRDATARPEPDVPTAPEIPPWWDPGSDASVSPETDAVRIGEVEVSRGSRVRLRPGARRADAQDMFLEGRIATVEAVFSDVENQNYLAVTLEDDPAAELYQWHGRYLYFSPDEVEPLEAAQ